MTQSIELLTEKCFKIGVNVCDSAWHHYVETHQRSWEAAISTESRQHLSTSSAWHLEVKSSALTKFLRNATYHRCLRYVTPTQTQNTSPLYAHWLCEVQQLGRCYQTFTSRTIYMLSTRNIFPSTPDNSRTMIGEDSVLS